MAEKGKSARDRILEAKGMTKRFEGLVAVDGLDFYIPAGANRQHHRSERRWQNHFLQLHHWLLRD